MTSDLKDTFDAFYDRFILRDLFAKVVPGAIVLASFAGAILGPFYHVQGLKQLILHVPVALWIPAIGVGWLAGFAVQGLGECIGLMIHYPRRANRLYNLFVHPTPNQQWSTRPICSNGFDVCKAKESLRKVYFKGDDEFTEFYIQVLVHANDINRHQIERCIVVIVACGNGSVAALVSSAIASGYLLCWGVGAPPVWLAWLTAWPTGWPFAFFLPTAVVLLVTAVCLSYMHFKNVHRQHLRMVEAISEQSLKAFCGPKVRRNAGIDAG